MQASRSSDRKLVNLMPHAFSLYAEDGKTLVATIQNTHNVVARLEEEQAKPALPPVRKCTDTVSIPVVQGPPVYGPVYNLPPDVVRTSDIIVSTLVAQQLVRDCEQDPEHPVAVSGCCVYTPDMSANGAVRAPPRAAEKSGNGHGGVAEGATIGTKRLIQWLPRPLTAVLKPALDKPAHVVTIGSDLTSLQQLFKAPLAAVGADRCPQGLQQFTVFASDASPTIQTAPILVLGKRDGREASLCVEEVQIVCAILR